MDNDLDIIARVLSSKEVYVGSPGQQATVGELLRIDQKLQRLQEQLVEVMERAEIMLSSTSP